MAEPSENQATKFTTTFHFRAAWATKRSEMNQISLSPTLDMNVSLQFFYSFLIAFLLIFPGSIAAQDKTQEQPAAPKQHEEPKEKEGKIIAEPDEFIGMLIRQVVFSGLINVQERDIKVLRQNNLNKELSPDVISNTIVDAFNLEYFSNVELKYQKMGSNEVRLYIEVEEKKRISRIVFEGRSSLLSRDKINEAIQLQERESFYDQAILRADERRIEAAYFNKGALNTTVSSAVQNDPSRANSIIITFFINEGERLRITGVDFIGSSYSKTKLFSARGLASQPINYKADIFFFSKDYVARDIEDDRAIYEAFYRSEGYLDMRIIRVEEILFRVSRRKLKVSKNMERKIASTKYLKLVYHIEEGRQYQYDGVTISGNELYNNDELLQLFTLEKGQPFNSSVFNASIAALQQKYISLGYAQTQIVPREKKDTLQQKVSYEIQIIESKVRNRIESIEIKGNTLTKDYVILREIPLQPGDIFNSAELRRGLESLAYTRFFESVEPEILQGSSPGLLRIILHVTEGQTLNISAGVRIAPSAVKGSFPISGTLQLGEQNFLGRGYSLATNLEMGVNLQKVQLSFGNSRVFGTNLGISASLGFTHSKTEGIAQDLDGNGVRDPFLNDDEFGKASATIVSRALQDFGMSKETSNISLGLNSSLIWRIPILNQYSRLTFSNGYSTNLSYVDYDNNVFRPFNDRTRANYQTWLFSDTFHLGLRWSTTDLPSEPNRGISLAQRFIIAGLIPTHENIYYLKSRSSMDLYLSLIEIYAKNNNYVFRLIFYLGTSFHILLEHPSPNAEKPDAQFYGSQLLRYTTLNRGSWSYDYGIALWRNTAELRYPLLPSILTIDLFFDALLVWRSLDKIRHTSIDDFRFTLGFGPRLTIPQLPLAIYITKSFRTENGKINGNPEPKNNVMTNGWAFSFVFNIQF